MTNRLGFAGRLAAAFITSKLTPMVIITSVLGGIFATTTLPREEEPQIIVPMIDIMVQAPGMSVGEVEKRVSEPMERLLWEVPGVEYVYSTSMPNMSMVIVRFKVGYDETASVVSIYNKMHANFDLIPPGVSQPIIKPRWIDDVAVLSVTLWGERYDGAQLRQVAANLLQEIKQVPDVSETRIIGGQRQELRAALTLGFRESGVVLLAIPTTLALTLIVFLLYGYTLNRITLFALIFTIGILVDDAIVVVENIVRHFRLPENRGRSRIEVAIEAVDEVGNPTILATFAVIAAILPLAFVRGLMGPYMRPIPVGASAAMVWSLLIAFVVSPWASIRLLRGGGAGGGHDEHAAEGWSTRLYRRIMTRMVHSPALSRLFLGGIVVLLLLAVALLRAQVQAHVLAEVRTELLVADEFPAEAILAAAEERGSGLVVLGSHGRTGIARVLLGSVSENVLREIRVPLVITRPPAQAAPPPPAITHILCSIDYTPHSLRAVEVAAALAGRLGARMTVLHSLESAGDEAAERERLCSWVPGSVESTCALQVNIARGEPGEQIVSVAVNEGADLIVVGGRHRSFLKASVLGSTTERVVRHAHCPVLTVVAE